MLLSILKFKQNPLINIIKHPFFIFYVLYLLFSTFSLLKALNFGDAIFELVKLFSLFFFLYLFTSIFANNLEIREKIVKLIILSSLFLITIFFFQLMKSGIIKNASTMTNKNLLSSTLFLMLPFVSFGIIKYRKIWKILGIISLGGIFICIFSLQTRSVWLAIIISSITILLVSLHFFKTKKSSLLFEILKNKSLYISSFLIFIIVISLLVNAQFTPKSYDSSLGRTNSIQARFFLWKATAKIIYNNIFMGIGLGNWKNSILSLGNKNFTDNAFTKTFYQRPHNDFLWVFSEIGLFGFIFYLLMFISIIFYIFQFLKKTSSETDFIFMLLMLFGIIGYLVIAFFSFPKERIFHQVLLHIYFFFALSTYYNKRKILKIKSNKTFFIICMIIFVQIMFSLLVVFKRLNAEIQTRKALIARTNKDWTEVIKNINSGTTIFYEIDPTSTPLMWYKGEAEYLLGNIQTALSNFITAHKISPYHLHVMNNLGTCYELAGEHENAISIYNKAINLYPKFNDTIVNLAIVYYNLEQYEMAYNTIMRSTEIDSNPKIKKYEKIFKEKIQKE
jgi:O-antigen ligase